MTASLLLAAHLVSLMAFVGGMLALWLAYAVLTDAWEDGRDAEALVELAGVLREAVIEPAMWAVLGTGGAMVALAPGRYLGQPWMWAKLALVGVLFALHGRLMAGGGRCRRGAAAVVVLKPGAGLGAGLG